MKINACPCHSGLPYEECCRPYHMGKKAENGLKLMRSRYAAYALNLAEYIMATTHENNPSYTKDRKSWKKGISEFSKNTLFQGLKILEFIDGEGEAFVTFTASLKQGDHDVSFTEKSRFLKIDGRWFYESGHVSGNADKL